MHGNNIHVSFYKDTAVLLYYSLLGLIKPIQFTAFTIDYGFRRIYVFRHFLILAQGSAAECNDFSGDGKDRKHNAGLEAVIIRAFIGMDA